MASITKPPWLDRVAAPLIVIEPDGKTVVADNVAAHSLLCPQGVLPLDLATVIGPSGAAAVRSHLAASEAPPPLTVRCSTAVGARALSLSFSPGEDGVVVTVDRATTVDATWCQTLEQVAAGLPIGLEIYDGDFHTLFCNATSDLFFDYDVAMLHHDDWWALAFPDPQVCAVAVAEWREKLDLARRDQSHTQSAEWTVLCRDGIERRMEFRFRFIGEIYVVVFWDVTERRRMEVELRELASTDMLTGLSNRRSFFEESSQAFRNTAAAREEISLLMVDIDHFKSINDRYGHGVGDQVLRAVAERCRGAVRIGDFIARIGGEEFAVLLPSTQRSEAEVIAHRLNAVIGDDPIPVGTLELAVKASIGGATRVSPDEALDHILERADRALYAAKSGGRNRVVFAD